MNVDEAGREGEPIAGYSFERLAFGQVADEGDFFADGGDVCHEWRVAEPVINAGMLVDCL